MRDREKEKNNIHYFCFGCLLFGNWLFHRSQSQIGRSGFCGKIQQRGSIQESGSMEKSTSGDWWVNSGGEMDFHKGVGRTIQRKLSKNSKWHKLYDRTNPKDTDNGNHPQNIFRLVTKTKWQNLSQQAYFKIKKLNLSDSENRNESNGLLLFNRYQDSNNLYYAGVRVDGHAVIKKKLNGEYFMLDYKKFFGGKKYNPKSRPSLLPTKRVSASKPKSGIPMTAKSRSSFLSPMAEKGNGSWRPKQLMKAMSSPVKAVAESARISWMWNLTNTRLRSYRPLARWSGESRRCWNKNSFQ